MELSVAKSLIEQGVDRSLSNQVWADLGAGDGLFTKALADLLPPNSKIISVDRNELALKSIALSNFGIELQTLVADMDELKNLPLADGIVMANSLHYIQNQTRFLFKLKKEFLKASGVLILIEYNLDKSNPWVPFPISKTRMGFLAKESGFELEILPKSVRSMLNSAEIYSAVLKPGA